MVLRCISICRTVLTEAVRVLACILPVELVAIECNAVYKAVKKAHARREKNRARQDVRCSFLRKQKDRLTVVLKGKQPCTLIPNLNEQISRSHGQLYFHFTQMFSAHGCFSRYLIYNAFIRRKILHAHIAIQDETMIRGTPCFIMKRGSMNGKRCSSWQR